MDDGCPKQSNQVNLRASTAEAVSRRRLVRRRKTPARVSGAAGQRKEIDHGFDRTRSTGKAMSVSCRIASRKPNVWPSSGGASPKLRREIGRAASSPAVERYPVYASLPGEPAEISRRMCSHPVTCTDRRT